MDEKVLYILGAGASAKALPLARTVWETSIPDIPKIRGLAYDLEFFSADQLGLNIDETGILQRHMDTFKKLAVKGNEFGDVDTYAKYLNIMNPGGRELTELKNTLGIYFAFKQIILRARDPRYLP